MQHKGICTYIICCNHCELKDVCTARHWKIFLDLHCSSSPMATPLPRAQTTLPAGCLTCVLTKSWWFTHMTTSSAASPLWHSPRVAAYCWLATTISTATSGTLWRPTVQVRRHKGEKELNEMNISVVFFWRTIGLIYHEVTISMSAPLQR